MEIVEQKIVDAFVALLRALPSIETAYDGRVTPFNPQEMPAANVFTPKTESAPDGTLLAVYDLALSIVLYVADKTAQKVIRSLVAELYAAIGDAERNVSGPFAIPEVISINDPTKVVKCIQQGDFIGSAQIALTITYRTARWAM